MLQNLDHYVNADVGREATTGVVHIRERNVLHRLIVPLTFEGADIDLDGVSPVTFVYQLPSGTQSNYIVTVADNCAIVPLGLTVVTAPGEVQCQLEAFKNDAKAFSTPIIRLEIAEDLYDPEAQEELEDLPSVYDQIVEDYGEWQAYIAALQAAVERGDFNGQDGADGAKGDKGEKGDPGTTDYNDLINKPTIPTVPEIVLSTNYNGDGNMNTDEKIISSKAVKAFVEGKGYITSSALSGYVQSSSLATVATSGSYNDLSNKPTIPTVPELSKSSTITQDISSDTKTVTPKAMKTWVDAQSFAASGDIPTVPTKVSDLTNDSGFITSSALSGYAQTADLATVATTGDYDDLTDKPTIPTKTSDLTNNSGFLTEHQSLAGYAQTADLAAVATSGSYADLSNKPTIPTVPDLSKSSTIAQDLSSDTKTVTPKAMKTWVDTQTDEVMQVANGKCACYVFDEKEDLDDWLEVAANVAKLHTGDVFLIRDTDVPDYWWDGSTSPGTTQVLETTKVDLDDYVQSTDLATVATSGSYADLSNKPSLATVATSGSYNDLSDKPSLATVATSGSYADLSNKPSLATVATSGSYNDLSNKPTIPTVPELSKSSTISSDISSDTKTVTPKAMKKWVEDKGYLTSHQSLSGYLQTGDNVSSLTNDAGYLTQHQSLTNYATKTYVDNAVEGITPGGGSGCKVYEIPIGSMTQYDSRINPPLYGLAETVPVTSEITSMFNDLTTTEEAIAYELDDGTYIPLTVGTSSGVTYLYNNADSDGDAVDNSKPSVWCLVADGVFDILTNEDRSNDTLRFRSGTPYVHVGDNVSELVNDAGYLTSHQSLSGYAKYALEQPLVVSGGDGANVGKIALDQAHSGQITNNSTGTIFGFLSDNATDLTVGSSSYALKLRGSGTRPKFNGNDLALSSDVPTVPTDVGDFNNDVGYITSSSLPSNPLTLSDKSNYNCNTRYDGKVWLVGSGSNCPSGSQYGALFTMPYRQASGNSKPDYAGQIFIPNGDDATKPNSMFYRTSLENSWNAWKEVAVEGACNADKIDGYHVSVVASLPASPDANTIYIVT